MNREKNIMPKWKVKLYDGMDIIQETVIVRAKGLKSASKIATFKTQIGSDYYIRAEKLTTKHD